MLITDGVHFVDGVKGAHVYLVTGQQSFLIDSGMPGQEKRIVSYLEKIELAPQSVSGIVLTHYDVDHVGSARALAARLNCPVYAHEVEIPYILGESSRPGLKRFLPYLVTPVYGQLQPPLTLRKTQNMFSDWEVLSTPGHTPGHVILYRNGIALVGDLLQGGKIRLAPSLFTWNPVVLRESVQKLISRPLRWILPGHGPATPASNHWLENLQRSL